MPTYIVLVNWTERGIQQVKDSPRRLDAAKKMLKEMGGEIKSVHLTMGECDLVVVCEASDDAVAARFALSPSGPRAAPLAPSARRRPAS